MTLAVSMVGTLAFTSCGSVGSTAPASSTGMPESTAEPVDVQDSVDPQAVTSPPPAVSTTRPSEEKRPGAALPPPLEVVEILRGPWRPYDDPNGFGAEVLLNREPRSAEEVVLLMREYIGDRDVASVTLFTSREAFTQNQANEFGEAWRRGMIAAAVRQRSHPGRAFYGMSRINWLQEVGPLSGLMGQATDF